MENAIFHMEGVLSPFIEDDENRTDTVLSSVCSVGAECNIDFTAQFTRTTIFQSRDELLQWIKDTASENGLVIVKRATNMSTMGGRLPNLYFACERSGIYRGTNFRSEKKTKKKTGSKKCGCPFSLKAKMVGNKDEWNVTVLCGVHNHPPATYLEGHSYAGRLQCSEMETLVELSQSLVKPREILRILKKRDKYNVTTIKTIYNARQKLKVVEMAGRSQMQQLMKGLMEKQYIEFHTSDAETSCVRNLFWAHPTSVDILRAFPDILIMDCTYKTNRYRLPLLDIVGVTSTEMTFSIAFCYLEAEREDCYTWALEQLRYLLVGFTMPRIILTDREQALINAISKVFPSAKNQLCRWHIARNVVANCKKFFEVKENWDGFISSWSLLVLARTEEDYGKKLSEFEKKFIAYPQAISYVKNSWLDKHKEMFVSAWTDTNVHFGNVTTNRAESSHAKLKKHLGSSACSFATSWSIMHSLLELQHTEIKASFEKSKSCVLHDMKGHLYMELNGFMAMNAMKKIVDQAAQSETIGTDAELCDCLARRIYGLPCAHEIGEYKRENRPIPLASIHSHWKKIDIAPMKEVVEEDLLIKEELDRVYKKYEALDGSSKRQMLIKLKEISTPTTTFLIEPEVKVNVRGRPKKKKKENTNTSTRREPSHFEHVLSAEGTCPTPCEGSSSKVSFVKPPRREKERVYRSHSASSSSPFMDNFPESIRPYVKLVKDVKADGNCGYRAIAGLLGTGEDNWRKVRMDLRAELNKNKDEYIKILSVEDVAHHDAALAYMDDYPPYSCWMTMPDIGYVIASCYSCVLHYLSNKMCLTFLPLWSEPVPLPLRRHITIGYVNDNHFVEVYLMDGSPIPPVASCWEKHHHPRANGWDEAYGKSMKKFRDIVSKDVATRDRIVIEDN